MPTVRIPLIGMPTNRDGSETFEKFDQFFLNGFPESITNEETDTKRFWFIKRAGHSIYQTFSGEGRGIYYWNNKVYSAVGNTVYEGTIPILTLPSTTGTVGFTATGSASDGLFICDGQAGWHLTQEGQLRSVLPPNWSAGATQNVGDIVNPVTYNGFSYLCIVAGTTGASQPTWPTTIGGTVVDGTVTWQAVAYVDFPTSQPTGTWAATTPETGGFTITVPTRPHLAFVATVGGTTGGTQPNWPVNPGATVVDGTVTWTTVDRSTLITGHVPKPLWLDGYIFLLNSRGELVSSGLQDPFSWPALDFIAPSVNPDRALWIDRQVNHIATFGSNSIQFFYDAGNETGSPLSASVMATLQIGCAAPKSVVQRDGVIFFVAKSGTGGIHVAELNGLKASPITNDSYNRVLEAEGDNIFNATAYITRMKGHHFYVLNLKTSGRTLVYDIKQQFWHEWTWNNSNMPFDYSTESGQVFLLQHSSTGTLYKMDITKYMDDIYPIDVQLQTVRMDGGNNYRKFCNRATLIGDKSTVSSLVSLSWSDDDYNTFNTPRTADLAAYRTTWTRCGQFRRRGWRISYSDDRPFRVEALELEVDMGKY